MSATDQLGGQFIALRSMQKSDDCDPDDEECKKKASKHVVHGHGSSEDHE